MRKIKRKKLYEKPDIRELHLNIPKKMDKKTLNEIISIITASPGT